MIDTVRTLAQPYSHYLMSHRDLVIVLMGLVVMWTVGHDLLTRWRNQRLSPVSYTHLTLPTICSV